MDSLITAAGRALAQGDVLGALKRVALREDGPALAIRGIAMAQLGEFGRAKNLLRLAVQKFDQSEVIPRARCAVAMAEIALASRDLVWPAHPLEAARATLKDHGDIANATHAQLLQARRFLLIGKVAEAEKRLEGLKPSDFTSGLRALYQLTMAGVAVRRVRAVAATEALQAASREAREAGIPALAAEIGKALSELRAPAARLISRQGTRVLSLGEVETLLAGNILIVDGCHRCIRHRNVVVAMSARPVLFDLVRELAESWPRDLPRMSLVARAFRGKEASESYRARLRVEIGRLRRVLGSLAGVEATDEGYKLVTMSGRKIVVLAPLVDGDSAALLALLSDGQSWSSSALGLALGISQRSVQRELDSLSEAGRVQAVGRGPTRRWTAPLIPGVATTLLLPLSLSLD